MQPILGSPELKSRKGEAISTELGYLWANLLQRGGVENHRSIGFCAIGEQEGANTLAANLALFLGSRGSKVVLVEASLRSPAMAGIFQTTDSPGLAHVLLEEAQLGDVVRQQVAPGVDLIPAGKTSDPFWSFTKDGLRRSMKSLLSDYDFCIVDVPSLNRAPEAGLVVRELSAVVLVVEANRHKADVVRRNVAHLRSLGTPFLGVVMTELVHEIPRPVARLI